jgi:hypothetical protein
MWKLSIPALDAAHRASDDNPVGDLSNQTKSRRGAFASRFSVIATALADPPLLRARTTASLCLSLVASSGFELPQVHCARERTDRADFGCWFRAAALGRAVRRRSTWRMTVVEEWRSIATRDDALRLRTQALSCQRARRRICAGRLSLFTNELAASGELNQLRADYWLPGSAIGAPRVSVQGFAPAFPESSLRRSCGTTFRRCSS